MNKKYHSPFHNTINVNGQTLMDFEAKAQRQDDKILEYFRAHPDGEFSPEDIWVALGFRETGVPLTSVRRSMTGLSKELVGVRKASIVKTGNKKMGLFGIKCNTYKLI